MTEILTAKANGKKLSKYDQFLFAAMKKQKLPPGGMAKLLKRYKHKYK